MRAIALRRLRRQIASSAQEIAHRTQLDLTATSLADAREGLQDQMRSAPHELQSAMPHHTVMDRH